MRGYVRCIDMFLLLFKTCIIYLQVIVAIFDKLPDTIAVTKVVTDFEAAIWKGVRETLFQVEIQGCVFHWRQAIWRHVQQLGFQVCR